MLIVVKVLISSNATNISLQTYGTFDDCDQRVQLLHCKSFISPQPNNRPTATVQNASFSRCCFAYFTFVMRPQVRFPCRSYLCKQHCTLEWSTTTHVSAITSCLSVTQVFLLVNILWQNI